MIEWMAPLCVMPIGIFPYTCIGHDKSYPNARCLNHDHRHERWSLYHNYLRGSRSATDSNSGTPHPYGWVERVARPKSERSERYRSERSERSPPQGPLRGLRYALDPALYVEIGDQKKTPCAMQGVCGPPADPKADGGLRVSVRVDDRLRVRVRWQSQRQSFRRPSCWRCEPRCRRMGRQRPLPQQGRKRLCSRGWGSE